MTRRNESQEMGAKEKWLTARAEHAPRQMSDPEAQFLCWAKQALAPLATVASGPPWDDLAPLGEMVGDASVVALTEGIHLGAEPLEFRNRVLRYLVEQKGFTAVAIESGLVESRWVHEYVRGGVGDLATVLAQGVSWTFDQLPQNRALVRWLREYNALRGGARAVNFYGFDVPGSPANPNANRRLDTALCEALNYLNGVDPAASANFRAQLDGFIQSLHFDLRRSARGPGYERLSASDRDTLTATIADLIALLERREVPYTAVSPTDEYAWALRAAIGARQADAWLRQIPLGWQAVSPPAPFPNENVSFVSVCADVRDRAQADNLDWIINREGANGKILIFAHRYHLSSAPVKARFWRANGEERDQQVAGTYLRRRLGARLLTIGNFLGGGRAGCSEPLQTCERAPADSFDGIAGKVGVPLFLLDLRGAPAPVKDWLNQEHWLAHGRQAFKLPVGRAFDILLYLDTFGPVVRNSVTSQTY